MRFAVHARLGLAVLGMLLGATCSATVSDPAVDLSDDMSKDEEVERPDSAAPMRRADVAATTTDATEQDTGAPDARSADARSIETEDATEATARADVGGETISADLADPAGRTVVPVIILDVPQPIVDEPDVEGTIRIIEDHPGTFINLADLAAAPVSLQSKMGIEQRGRSTQNYPKKAYSIELWNEARTAAPRVVLGMPREADFALLACYLDRTCMRNALALQLGRELGGGWQPRLEFVEVFLNGSYRGLYQLAERIKRDKNRVNLAAPAPDLSMPGADISGGYMLRIEFDGKGLVFGTRIPRDFTSASGQIWTYHYPRAEAITSAQRTYIRGYVDRFEAAMAAPGWDQSENGYPKWIDIASWVDYALMKELGRDVDAYRISSYSYKLPDSAGGKLYWGPLWDFDRAFGNAGYFGAGSPEGWSFEGARPELRWHHPPPFWKRIFLHAAFQKRLACRWREVRKGPITMANINSHIDRWGKFLSKAAAREEAKWKLAGTQPDGGIPRFKPFAEAIADLRAWTQRRIAWMDSVLNPRCP